MITKEEARKQIQKLIEKYNGLKDDKTIMQNERQICDSLIRPFFRDVLGWNIEDPYEFKSEYSQGGKRVDYASCINGVIQFVIEAKAPSREVKDVKTFYEQAIQYAEYKSKEFAILTNFTTIIVLRAGIGKNIWDNEIRRVDLLNIKEGDIEFLLYFQRDFWVQAGEQNPLYSQKILRKKKPVDDTLADSMKTWRELLLRSLKANNQTIDLKMGENLLSIETEVQRFIDRLIFICYCEDKKIEESELKPLLKDKIEKYFGKEVMTEKVREIFRRYHDRYNSDLFKEGLCDKLIFDDKTISEIFRDLRDPVDRMPYDFSIIDADVLGRAYESFLGHILTGKVRFKEKEDTGKRKESGIYYTPQYIVNYIVFNTVREAIKGKPFEEIVKIKILDPACGSGAFLIKVFDILVEESKISLKVPELKYEQKEKLLLNCIFGVDKDERACDIAKLNLSLKIATAGRKIPELHKNIQNGDSLIDDESVEEDEKAFKWEERFFGIIQFDKDGNLKDGYGFDVIIGNPPYVKLQTLDKKLLEFYYLNYKSATKHFDIYALFVERALSLLNKGGVMGFILPSKFFTSDYGLGLRKIISDNKSLMKVINFKDFQVFDDATTYTCLLFLEKNKRKDFEYLEIYNKEKLTKTKIISLDIFNVSTIEQPSELQWNFSSGRVQEIMNKLSKNKINLGGVCEDIFQGLLTGRDKFFFVQVLEDRGNFVKIKNGFDKQDYTIEKFLLKKLLKGKEIRRWVIDWKNTFLIYPYEIRDGITSLIDVGYLKSNYPKTYQYLLNYKKQLMNSETSEAVDETNWYRFRRARSFNQFEQTKIITQVLASRNSFALDESDKYYFVGGGNAGGFGLVLKESYSKFYHLILGLLNSSLLEFYIKKISTPFRGGFYSYGKKFIERLPLVIFSDEISNKISKLVKNQITSHQKLIEAKNKMNDKRMDLEDEIKRIDKEIDELVYKIYGITEAEKKIIEDSLR